MRKTWTTLVVLGILLCMFVSLGANAHAAEDALTILAVNGDALSDEQIAALKNEYANGYILDVSGNGTSKALDIVFNEAHPLGMDAIGPQTDEHVPEILYLADPMTLKGNEQKITLIGVNHEVDSAMLGTLIAEAEGKVVAVGTADGGEAVKQAAIDLFLTTDASDGVQTMVTANVGYTQVVNVGKDDYYPITKVTLDSNGDLQAEPMEAPAPGVVMAPGPVENGPEIFEPAVYSVTYEGNGANGGYMDPAQVTEGNDLTLPGNGFTYDGNDFIGWEVNGEIRQPGEAVTISGDTTITAQWAPVYVPAVYDVAYDPNGADGGYMDPTQVTEGNDLTLPACGYTYTGYTFAGWNVDGSTYQPGENAPLGGSTTVYALWEPEYVPPVVYTVNYLPNGANGGWMDASQVTEGNDLTLPACGFTYDGYQFTGWSVNDETRQPGEVVAVSGDTDIIAQWQEIPVTASAPSVELTYTAGEGTGEDVKVTVEEGTVFAECTFAAPEGKHFDHWDVNGEAHNVNDPVTITESATATAIYADDAQTTAAGDPGLTDKSIRTWTLNGADALTITFTNATVNSVAVDGTALDAGSYTIAASGSGSNVTFPAAYLNTLTADQNYSISFNFAAGADGTAYPETVVFVSVKAAAPRDPGFQGGSDMYTWKNGGTDKLEMSFANAKVATVSVGAEGVTANTLTEGSQYTVGQYGDHGQTVTFQQSFLNTLQPATYNVKFTFLNAEDGSTYNEVSTKLSVSAADEVQTRRENWNRAGELTVTFSGKTPNGLELQNSGTWVSTTNDKDYRLNGSSIALLPAMVNGGSRWQAWGNGLYHFRVSFTDGTTELLDVIVEGTAPAQATTAPTATPVPGTTAAPTSNGPTSPVTGDETPIALYVAILVLLVAALAIVIILLTKKKSRR